MSERCRVCTPADIRCKNLSNMRDFLSGRDTRLLLRGAFSQVGTSGHVKKQIVDSIFPDQVLEWDGGVPLDSGRQTYKPFENKIPDGVVSDTDEADGVFMSQARDYVSESDCWWRPTACVVVQGDEVVIHGVSKNMWGTKCEGIPLDNQTVQLDPGEKIDFCDAIHAERVAVSNAARTGVPLEGSEVYVTTCPCEECAKVLVEAGVVKLVFESDYYNVDGLVLLHQNGIEIARFENTKND